MQINGIAKRPSNMFVKSTVTATLKTYICQEALSFSAYAVLQCSSPLACAACDAGNALDRQAMILKDSVQLTSLSNRVPFFDITRMALSLANVIARS